MKQKKTLHGFLGEEITSYETAIVYRRNDVLSERLKGLKDQVEVFKEFPEETTKEEIQKWGAENLGYNKQTCLFADATCLFAINRYHAIEGGYLIRQDKGNLDAYVAEISRQAKENNLSVAIIKKCIAHHAYIDGISPYDVGEGKDTWYADKVLKLWDDALKEHEVPYKVFTENPDIKTLYGQLVVCDSHNRPFNSEVTEAMNEGLLFYATPHNPATKEVSLEELMEEL